MSVAAVGPSSTPTTPVLVNPNGTSSTTSPFPPSVSPQHTGHDRPKPLMQTRACEDTKIPAGGDVKADEISAVQKMIAACSGSLFTSLLVTPLDVVRVRLQSQQPINVNRTVPATSPPPPRSSIPRVNQIPISPVQFRSSPNILSTPEIGVTACCREVFWVNNTAEGCLAAPIAAPQALPDSCAVDHASRKTFQGTWEGLVKIARYEGATSLWRGLSPTLLMAVPANVIYFTGYDYLRHAPLSPLSQFGATWAPLIAGSSARTIAATVISPLELFRTRLQAAHSHHSEHVFRDTLRGVKDMVAREGFGSLWRGLSLTLWRDVPFSGFYWLGYEVVKDFLRDRRESTFVLSHWRYPEGDFKRAQLRDLHEEATFVDSFLAGAASGSIAAFLTTPFDVGKTRRQISDSRQSMPRVLMDIWKDGGARALWRGYMPRMLKVSPACAIMISSYELGKKAAVKVNESSKSAL